MQLNLVKLTFKNSEPTYAVISANDLDRIKSQLNGNRGPKGELLEYVPAITTDMTEQSGVYYVPKEGSLQGFNTYAKISDIARISMIIENVRIDHNGLTSKM